MSWLDNDGVLIDVAMAAVGFAANWFLQSTLLVAIGLVVGTLAARRGAAVQSAVYRTTLVAVLICPLASWLLALAGFSGWSLAMPEPWTEQLVVVAAVAPAVEAPPANEPPIAEAAPVAATSNDTAEQGPIAGAPPQGLAAPAALPLENPVPSTAASPPPVPEPATPTAVRMVSVNFWGLSAAVIAVLWIVVCAAFLARLATAWWRLARLRKGAVPADVWTLLACQELAARLGVRAPAVLVSPYLPSPCLAGLRRPAVLLPEAELSLSIQDVLVHELAHLARRDCHWNLLRQLVLAALFCQPLLWMLSRRLEAAAEEVCDDYVVQYGGDRETYALRLVDIAELSTAPMAAAGVGIVSLRSMLARRVQRIMDTSRSLSTRVGNLLLALVLVGGLVGTTMVGLVGIGPQSLQADPADDGAVSKEIPVASEVGSSAADDEISVRGHVVDSAGKPVVGATVRLVRWYWDPRTEHKPLSEAKSGAAGDFEIAYRKSQFDVDVRRPEQWREVVVAAFAPGSGPDWVWLDDVPAGEQAELRLPPDGMPLEGRVVDLEGRPLAGVRVECGLLSAPKGDDLSPWIEAVKLGEPPWTTHRHLRNSGLPFEGTGLPNELITAADGRFRLTGVGRERRLDLTFTGSNVARTAAIAVTRKMSPIAQVRTNSKTSDKTPVLGAEFEITLPPTRVIEGVVRDAKTGQSLAGVSVQSWRFAGSTFVAERHLRTESDAEGRFRLVGMPKGERNEIVAVPNDEQPYLMRVLKVPDEPGLGPVAVALELHRGIWITGRATDKLTGKPVRRARLYYLPFLENKYAQTLPEFQGGSVEGTNSYQDRYQTADDGNYRLVGLPGRAIVGIDAVHDSYYKGAGAADIAGMDATGHLQTFQNPLQPSKKWPTAIKEIEPAEQAESVVLDFALDPGNQIEITTTDPAGEPIADVKVTGIAPGTYRPPTTKATFRAVAFAPDEERTLLLHHEKLGLGKVIRTRAGEKVDKLAVRLEPCATIKGRLVDENQSPITGAQIRLDVLPSGDFGAHLTAVTTDSEGRFAHTGVLPGGEYAVNAEGVRVGYTTIAKKVSAEPGEIVDLGTIDVTKDERPEPGRMKMPAPAKLAENTTAAKKVAGHDDDTGRDDDAHEFKGQVVDPAGKPVAGADVYLVFHVPQPTGLYWPTWKPVAETGADGKFDFKIGATDLGSQGREFGYGALVAVKEGFGFAWSQAATHETRGRLLAESRERMKRGPVEFLEAAKNLVQGGKPIALVVDDEPIRGRVMDINGQPVAGARLTLLEVSSGAGDDLTAWRAAAQDPKADYYSARMKTMRSMNGPQVRSLVKPALSDSEGQFTLRGVGKGRIVELLLEGPGIETTKIFARTEPGKAIELVRERRDPDLGTYTYHPAEFTYVAGPSVAIAGVVRDAETKAPLAGVTVKSQRRHGERINGWGQDFVRAVTDAEGKYRLEGMPLGEDNRIAAIRPAGDVAYLSMIQKAPTTSPDLPLAVDFDLRRGVWIEGRVTDKATGEAKTGVLSYYVKTDNPNYALGRTMRVDERDSMQTDTDGRFRIAALPGPGLVAIMARDHEKYPRADAILKLDGTREKAGGDSIKAEPSFIYVQNYHVVAEVDPAADAKITTLNLELDSGDTVVGRVLDDNGKPLESFYYSGQFAQFPVWKGVNAGSFELRGYDPASPRHVYFCDATRNLAGSVIVSGKSPENLTVKLQPGGTVRGRVLDKDGFPVANSQLIAWAPRRTPGEVGGGRAAPLPHNVSHSQIGQHETDGQGRFEISCLAPGVEYRLKAFDMVRMAAGGGRMSRVSDPLDVVIRLEPGEVRDLGDVPLVDEDKFSASLKQARQETGAVKPLGQTVIKGRIMLADGTPARDANVAAVASPISTRRGGDLSWRDSILTEGKTDQDGNYRLSFAPASSKTHQYPKLLARQEGHGVAWSKLDLDAPVTDASFVLPVEAPIRGKLVDIEGQPAAGVVLTLRSVSKTTSDGSFDGNGVGFRSEQSCAAWPAGLTSDAEGRFTIHGVPLGHGLFLDVAGNERFAPQSIMLNTGIPEQRGERDATYRSLVRNVAAGEEAVLPLSPVQLFEGVVRYEDTGEPAPHARLTIWASQQEQVGSMTSVAGQADAEGKFRISPNPGVRFGINAYAPDGAPYLGRATPLDESIRWQAGDRVRQVDVKLPRGVLVRGKIVEAGSNAPVAGASIQYMPEESNNPLALDHIMTGWQAIELSGDDGKFAIAVLPGPGRLLVHGPPGKYVLVATSDSEIRRGKPGGRRNYVHAVERIEPAAGAEPLDLSIELRPGATISGRLVDEQGKAIDEALVISSLEYSPHSLHWRGFTPPTLGGKFELKGLGEQQEYNVYFLDAKRQLGATQTLRADGKEMTVVLKPCGQASARFVNLKGESLVKFNASLHIVVTPGVHEHDWDAAKAGKLAADADFVANVDRTNYWPGPMTDTEGRITFPALIPGAIYRINSYKNGKPIVHKEFSVKSGEKVDLGEIAFDLER